jgi:hypothetical protein
MTARLRQDLHRSCVRTLSGTGFIIVKYQILAPALGVKPAAIGPAQGATVPANLRSRDCGIFAIKHDLLQAYAFRVI